MADKELLELAARAAGIDVREYSEKFGIGLPLCKWWNPLADDGDSRRLEVKLKMQVHVDGYGSAARVGEGIWSAC